MATDVDRSNHRHDDLTVPVEQLAPSLPAGLPLPALQAVTTPPAVVRPGDEPLVDVTTVGIPCLGAYARQGWAGSVATCWVRTELAERLTRVAAALPDRWHLAVFDAWRPTQLQQALLDDAHARGLGAYVSPPSDDPRFPAPHLTGGAVDLTLQYDGTALALGTGFDDFTPRAHPGAFEPGGTAADPRSRHRHDGHQRHPEEDAKAVEVVRAARRLLYWAMHAEGFVVHDLEWWHFEWGTARWAAIRGEEPRYGPAAPPTLD